MQINGINIPDAGSTTEYIADKIGGWLYKITTTTEVEQQHLYEAQDSIDALDAQIKDMIAQKSVLQDQLLGADPSLLATPQILPDVSATTTAVKL